jgi:hypothetical protein
MTHRWWARGQDIYTCEVSTNKLKKYTYSA